MSIIEQWRETLGQSDDNALVPFIDNLAESTDVMERELGVLLFEWLNARRRLNFSLVIPDERLWTGAKWNLETYIDQFHKKHKINWNVKWELGKIGPFQTILGPLEVGHLTANAINSGLIRSLSVTTKNCSDLVFSNFVKMAELFKLWHLEIRRNRWSLPIDMLKDLPVLSSMTEIVLVNFYEEFPRASKILRHKVSKDCRIERIEAL